MKYPLEHIMFETTQECNLSCRYCYNHWRRNGATTPVNSTFSQIMRTLKKIFASIDTRHITFTGGETFLAEELAELVLYCRMKGKNVNVITNGTCVVPDKLRHLVSLGVSIFELPLLSDSSELHDYLTGVPGSFDKVLDTISQIKQLKAQLCVVFVLTKVNINRLPATLARAEKLGISRFMLARFNIGGRGISNCKDLLPSLYELRAAFSVANDFAAAHRLSITANVCLPRCIIDQADYRSIPVSTCSADFRKRPITIDFTGNARMCSHSPVIMGNIFDQPVESIFSSDYARSWETAKPGFCDACAKWDRCHGGCRAASEQMGGNVKMVDPIIEMITE